MIHIIDYGAGNIGSIVNMLKKAGSESKITSNPDEIMRAAKLVLPGVGNFDYGMKKLNDSGLVRSLNKKVLIDKCPILGICLGAQLMTNSSEEGREKGLGWFNAEVVKFDSRLGIRIPHMGWNNVVSKKHTPLNENFVEELKYYFVHSYFIKSNEEQDVLFKTTYGEEFVSALNKNNIYAVQFHPEKSHKFGLNLFQNFVKL